MGGCETSQLPPSAENKICEKFHKQIKQLKDKKNKHDINEDFVKAFLETPTVPESLLIPTNEIRFGFWGKPRQLYSDLVIH